MALTLSRSAPWQIRARGTVTVNPADPAPTGRIRWPRRWAKTAARHGAGATCFPRASTGPRHPRARKDRVAGPGAGSGMRLTGGTGGLTPIARRSAKAGKAQIICRQAIRAGTETGLNRNPLYAPGWKRYISFPSAAALYCAHNHGGRNLSANFWGRVPVPLRTLELNGTGVQFTPRRKGGSQWASAALTIGLMMMKGSSGSCWLRCCRQQSVNCST